MDGDRAHPLLEAEGLVKSYVMPHKRVRVLSGAWLRVEPGELVAVVGRSGAGKSTLLHVLGGLDRPDEGDVRLSGRSLYSAPARRAAALRAAGIGFVFQAYHLMPEMDVTENVCLPAMATGRMGREAMRERALRLLGQVGLAGRASHMPVELSGGEQQRVAIARALMNAPGLVLADEPTGNLDRATGEKVMDLLLALVRERGSSLVVVTHDPAVAARCGRRLSIEDGKIVEARDRTRRAAEHHPKADTP